MFYDRDLIDPAVGDLMVDEFRRIYHSPGARFAFLSSARNIYLESPYGRNGFYPRLAGLTTPALFVWGTHDRLIPPGFGRHVRKWLPSAEQVTLQSCGHVPQVERPAETNELLLRFFARADAAGWVSPTAERGRPRRLATSRPRIPCSRMAVADKASSNGHVAERADGGSVTDEDARRRATAARS